jgi:hypothetical protein
MSSVAISRQFSEAVGAVQAWLVGHQPQFSPSSIADKQTLQESSKLAQLLALVKKEFSPHH